jgi:proline iminopeptidase
MLAAMLIDLNGVRLYFDIEGAGLVPDGELMRQRPTVILLHGGPDNSCFAMSS